MTTFWSQKAVSLTDWFWNVIYARTALFLNASLRPSAFLIHPLLTVLCACPQQVDDVLVFANNLHHFHLRDEIWQVLLCGVGYKSNIDEHTHILVWQITEPSTSMPRGAIRLLYSCFPFSYIFRCGLEINLTFKTMTWKSIQNIIGCISQLY